MKGKELGKLLLDGLLVAENGCLVAHKDKNIDFLGRFFGKKSVFGGAGKDFRVEKSSTKNSV